MDIRDETIAGVLELIAPRGTAAPVFFDSPHSGAEYPTDFRPAAPMALIRRAEDAWIDELYESAPSQGATLLKALFPRAYLDPNRDAGDIDLALLDQAWPGKINPGAKTAEGHGLVWRLVGAEAEPLYDRKLSVAEVQARIERCHVPYHARMRRVYENLAARFGGIWHVDCHSMPAIGNATAPDAGKPRADFVLGDRDGTTCARAFTDLVAGYLKGRGYSVKINDPYKGVELVRAFGDPARNRHAIQIEINRRLYMDEASLAKSAGFSALKADIQGLIGTVVGFARRQVETAVLAGPDRE